MLSYLGVRGARGEPAEERYATGTSRRLRYDGDARYRLVGPSQEHVLEPEDFPNFLLTLDDAAGARARLAYDDFPSRAAMWAPKHRPVALASIPEVTEDGRVRLDLKTGAAWIGPTVGQHCVLDERYTDWNSRYVIEELAELDDEGRSWFARLIADPRDTPAPLIEPPSLRRDVLELAGDASMTRSQLDALTGVLGSDVQLVWGPPGTGKTPSASGSSWSSSCRLLAQSR